MNLFNQFGIAPTEKGFTGDKIKINRILNREIIVKDFKIEPSKFTEGSGKRLCIHLELNGIEHIIFTGSVVLMETIERVPRNGFPFKTTIINNNDRYEFT